MNNRATSLGAALIVLLTVVAYVPAMRGGFIWDDDSYVTDNPTLRSTEGLRQIWLNPDATVQYYPLTFTVFWLEYQLWGLQPFGYHLVNVLLQAANALLFWRLLSRLRVPGAWWAAAVFAVHPVHVMSVAWITELKNVLSGFFFLAALLAYLRFCDSNRGRFYGLALGLYLCALLSKTATSLLPAAVLLTLWWKQGRIGRKELVPLLPLFVMGILFGVFTLWLEKHAKGASGREFTLPFLERVLVAGRSFWFCLGKLLWPARVTFVYPRWQMDATSVWPYLFPLSALGLLGTLWWVRGWVGRAPLAALVYFLLAFPALILMQVLYMMRYTFVADHWQYLGSMSVIALVVGGAVTGLSPFRKTGFAVGTVVLVALGVLTWRQGLIYRDVETLWRDTLAKNPNCWMAYLNLGNLLVRENKMPDAAVQYETALAIKPDDPEAHNNLGNVLLLTGRPLDAIPHFREALRVKPNHAAAHNNLGLALWRTDRAQEAIEHYEQALRIKPGYAEAHYNLGLALSEAGKTQEAIEHFEHALRIQPDSAEPHYNLGVALWRSGQMTAAVEHWEQALRIKPDYAEAHNSLANALMHLDRRFEAIEHYEQAVRLNPDFAQAHNNLGAALVKQGRLEDAILHFELALRLRPNYAMAHYNLGSALEQKGRLKDAIEHYEEALRIQPDLVEAQQDLARLRGSH